MPRLPNNNGDGPSRSVYLVGCCFTIATVNGQRRPPSTLSWNTGSNRDLLKLAQEKRQASSKYGGSYETPRSFLLRDTHHNLSEQHRDIMVSKRQLHAMRSSPPASTSANRDLFATIDEVLWLVGKNDEGPPIKEPTAMGAPSLTSATDTSEEEEE